MCRTREDIIASDITCQELCDFIDKSREAVKQGKNGSIHFELLQARASLEERVARIQMQEDMMKQFGKADDKRNIIDKKVDGAFENITKCQEGLDAHLDDCKANPNLRKVFVEKPIKTFLAIIGIVTGYATAFFFIAHALMFGTGFDVIFQKFLENIMGQ